MMQQGFQSTAQSPHHAALQAAHGGGSPSGYSNHGPQHSHAHSQMPVLPPPNHMQITLSNSINKGKSGAAGVGGAYAIHP